MIDHIVNALRIVRDNFVWVLSLLLFLAMFL